MSPDVVSGPRVRASDVTFEVRDTDGLLRGVTLRQELDRTGAPVFTKPPASDTWRLRYPRPAVDRMEYQLELRYSRGGAQIVIDPSNPLTAGGPFGAKSVIEFPGYRRPAWLDVADGPAGRLDEFAVRSTVLGSDQPVVLWSSACTTADQALPLLVAHDGPEYAAFSSLVTMLDCFVHAGRLPPMRAALLPPVDRNEHYSASPAYARALATEVLPFLDRVAPTAHARVGMGASLGALAMVHAHRTHPATFGALFLQSGSFFVRRHDAHESWLKRFERITRFVERVHAGRGRPARIPIVMTCGTAEENLANNRDIGHALTVHGYPVRLYEVRDAHNWVAWRDAFDPYLVDLLTQMWSRP